MTISEINNLTLLDQSAFEGTLIRVVDFSLVPENEASFTIAADATGLLSLYDRLLINPQVTLPADLEAQMDAEFPDYILFLLAEENDRLIDVARVIEEARLQDIKARVSNLSDYKLALNSLYPTISNSALYLKAILEADVTSAETMVSNLEAEDLVKINERASVQYKDDRKLMYPSMSDQLDMQYWDAIDGTTLWIDLITSIKDTYPKP